MPTISYRCRRCGRRDTGEVPYNSGDQYVPMYCYSCAYKIREEEQAIKDKHDAERAKVRKRYGTNSWED